MGEAGERALPGRQGGKLWHRMKQPPHQTQDDEEQNRGAHREMPRHPAFVQSLAADMGHDRADRVLHGQQKEDQPMQDLSDQAVALCHDSSRNEIPERAIYIKPLGHVANENEGRCQPTATRYSLARTMRLSGSSKVMRVPWPGLLWAIRSPSCSRARDWEMGR